MLGKDIKIGAVSVVISSALVAEALAVGDPTWPREHIGAITFGAQENLAHHWEGHKRNLHIEPTKYRTHLPTPEYAAASTGTLTDVKLPFHWFDFNRPNHI